MHDLYKNMIENRRNKRSVEMNSISYKFKTII